MDVDIELYRRDVSLPHGPRLSVIDIAPEQPAHTLVLVHGFGGQASQWRYQLGFFSDDMRVIAPDLRGHGRSDKPHSLYDMGEITGDLHALLAALGVRGKIILAGHSFGGAMVTEYATRYPDQVDKLVLMAASGEYTISPAAKIPLSLPTPVLQAVYPFIRHRFFAPAHVLKTLYWNNFVLWRGWDLLRRLTMPTLIIRGYHDTVLEKRLFAEVAQVVPNAEDVDVGASKHMVMLERREAVNRALERFMAGQKRTNHIQQRRQRLRQQRPWLDHYDEGVPYSLGVPPVPVTHLLSSAAMRFPARPALVYEGRTWTYAALEQASNQLAHALRGLGVRPGDRALILLPNLPQTVIAFYGVLKAGAVVVFTTPLSDPGQLARQIRDSGATTLITLTRLADTARQARVNTSLQRVVYAHVADYLPPLKRLAFGLNGELAGPHRLAHPQPGENQWHGLLAGQPTTPPDIPLDPDGLALLQYTSGTTAEPKGVMLTHRNLVANTLQLRHWIPSLREGAETTLAVLPFSHSYGTTVALNVSVALAARMVVLPTFITAQVVRAIQAYRPSIFPGVPTMYTALNAFPNIRQYGLDSIRACLSGAAPLPVEVQEAFEKITKGRLIEGYGLTEATTATHANPLGGLRKSGSVGVPLPATEAQVVDVLTGEPLEPGQLGELAVRGPQVMGGYWPGAPDRPPETATTPEGWLLTGDLARMDADGFFEIVARKRDMILAGAYQVYPRDVEEVLYEHPKVKEVAVVGVQAAQGQQVKAYVVPKEGVTLSADELRALCQRRLEAYAVPWDIEFRTELPKNFVGKIIRRLLVEPADNQRTGD